MGSMENLVLIRSGSSDWHWNTTDWVTAASINGLFWFFTTAVTLLALSWLFRCTLRQGSTKGRAVPAPLKQPVSGRDTYRRE